MSSKPVSLDDPVPNAEEHLWRALRASDATGRIAHAEAGLAVLEDDAVSDTRVLLLRQRYLAEVALHRLQAAADTAAAMAAVGPLRDIAHHDHARVLQALGQLDDAVGAQRLAARHAPPERRSFHLWSLATLQHFAGDVEGALATLERALRCAQRDRPLLDAHAAFIQLEDHRPVEGLPEVLARLKSAPCREGYGQFLLGMLYAHLGDAAHAAVHLRAFLRRNARIDEAKALTLREELRRARRALAAIESD